MDCVWDTPKLLCEDVEATTRKMESLALIMANSSLPEDLIKRMHEQQAEATRLRQMIQDANSAFLSAGQSSQEQLEQAVKSSHRVLVLVRV